MSAITDAIAAHKAAWTAFQSAMPADAAQAEDRECEALVDLLNTPAADVADLVALGSHLRWYVDEEPDQAGAQARAMLSVVEVAVGVLAPARALLEAVEHDNNGSVVGGQYVGGNGGLLSRETIITGDALRRVLGKP